jgi:hypothetical protein
MNHELLFDMICHGVDSATKGTNFKFPLKGKDIEVTPLEQKEIIHKSIQAFLFAGVNTVNDAHGKERKIQAYSGSSDLVALTKDVFNVTNAVNSYDALWQESFKTIQLKRGQLSWEIATRTNGLKYRLIPEFGKVSFESIAGTKDTVSIYKYGTGLAVTWEMIEGRKLYQFADLMEDQRAALYEIWANVHYGLLAAAAEENPIIYQGETDETTLDRDIQTINYACWHLSDVNKNKGYGDTANMPFKLYVNPLYKDRILAALRATSADVIRGGHSGVTVNHIVEPYFTNDSRLASGAFTLVLPMRKIQNALYMKDQSFKENDMTTLSVLTSHWTAFGGTVADTEQCAEVALADEET